MSAGNNCRIKIAHFSAQLERYQEAAEIFEDVRVASSWPSAVLAPLLPSPCGDASHVQVGKACLGNNLLKFNARGHFLNSGICILASGVRGGWLAWWLVLAPPTRCTCH